MLGNGPRPRGWLAADFNPVFSPVVSSFCYEQMGSPTGRGGGALIAGNPSGISLVLERLCGDIPALTRLTRISRPRGEIRFHGIATSCTMPGDFWTSAGHPLGFRGVVSISPLNIVHEDLCKPTASPSAFPIYIF